MPRKLRDMTEPELADAMQRAARAVAKELPPKSLFVLVAFDEPGLAQYISNCQRTDMIRSMRATADRLEAKQIVQRVKFHD